MPVRTPTVTVRLPDPKPARRKPRNRADDGSSFTCLPDFVHLLALPYSDRYGDDLGILVIRGHMHAFQWSEGNRYPDERFPPYWLLLVPAGAFGENQTVTVDLNQQTGRWECEKCRVQAGLHASTTCDHCEAARLVELFKTNRRR